MASPVRPYRSTSSPRIVALRAEAGGSQATGEQSHSSTKDQASGPVSGLAAIRGCVEILTNAPIDCHGRATRREPFSAAVSQSEAVP